MSRREIFYTGVFTGQLATDWVDPERAQELSLRTVYVDEREGFLLSFPRKERKTAQWKREVGGRNGR